MEPGSELGWAGLAGPNAPAVATDTFTYAVYKDPNWDWHTLNPDTDTARADKNDNGLIDAIDPNSSHSSPIRESSSCTTAGAIS